MSSAEELIALLTPPDQKSGQLHRPPWTWHALTPAERPVLAELTDNWVGTYNRTWATKVEELVPPCWLRHEGLAIELPVMLWQWYSVHRSQAAQVGAAAEFYIRHLPAFRGRVAPYLGEGAEDCRAGRHPGDDWRHEINTAINSWSQPTGSGDVDEQDRLAELHCGFGPAPDF